MASDPRRDQLRASLERALGTEQVISDPVELLTYERDAGFDGCVPDLVVLPRDRAAVAAAVTLAAAAGVPVVPRGAGTGLAGGAVAVGGGLVLNLARMDGIAVDGSARLAVVGAGAVTEAVDAQAKRLGLSYPPDPSSGRTSSIGGNIGTNAGGPHCFKYGVTTNYVNGVELVLADGRTLRFGGEVVDAPGYDLLGLIVGSEGTLGVITRAWLRLVRQAPGVRTLLAAFDSVEQAGRAVSAVIASGLVPATMEMMDRGIMRIVEDYVPAGLPVDAEAALIIDVDGYVAGLDRQLDTVGEILTRHGARGVQVARTDEQRERIWYGRKSAAGAISRLAPAYHLIDVTVPRSRLAETLERINAICDRCAVRVGYVFHAGDGNLHPLILFDPRDAALVKRVHEAAREIVEVAVAANGSITGEHGVAVEKREYMSLMYGRAELSAMRDIKEVFDPGDVMNPGKVLPEVEPPSVIAAPARLEGPVLTPASAEEASALLVALGRQKQRVSIGGAPSGVAAGSSMWLSTARLAGVLEYSPDDLYVRVGAGMPLSMLEGHLAPDRLQVALRSAWNEATVGGVVAANVNAPSRLRYGPVRDQVMATTAVLGDGRVLRAGRPVVKNVAGYDLPKVFVGSHGTLGLLVDVTLRIMPRPAARRSLVVPVDTLSSGIALSTKLRPLALSCSGIVMCGEALIGGNRGHISPAALVYTAEGLDDDVTAELDEVAAAIRRAGGPAGHVHGDVTADGIWAGLLGRWEGGSVLLRVGVPIGALQTLGFDAATDDVLIDAAAGVCHLALAPGDRTCWHARADSVCTAAIAAGGYGGVVSAPLGADIGGTVCDYRPPGVDLMQALKTRWDPAGVLNPAGIPGAGF